MTVYKEIHKYNFEDDSPAIGENTHLFFRINKKQDLAGITIPLYEEYTDPETGEVVSRPILQEKTVQATVDDQVVTPDIGSGFLGLSQVVVTGLNSQDVNITPTQNQQLITVNGYVGTIQVAPVTSIIDGDIQEANIRHGVNILGTTGTYTGDKAVQPVVSNETLIMYEMGVVDEENPTTLIVLNPDTSGNVTVGAGTERQVYAINRNVVNLTVLPVTAAIDSDITTTNIRHGVDILGVTGTYTGDE